MPFLTKDNSFLKKVFVKKYTNKIYNKTYAVLLEFISANSYNINRLF